MKSLKEHILEGILDIEDNINIDASEMTKDAIEQFLKDNYKILGSYTIKNVNDKFIIDVKGRATVANKNITSLTNGLFEFGKVEQNFSCSRCESLTSLKGAPREVGTDFNCSYCYILKTLEGAPERVGGDFYCGNCNLLTSLEGAPEEVGGSFWCSDCNSLASLKGGPKKVGESFYCEYCKSLKSLKGGPKKVGGGFWCTNCGTQFTRNDVKKYINAKKIFCNLK